MKEFQDQQVEDMHMEKCLLESDRKLKYNLSQQINKNNTKIKDVRFVSDMHQRQEELLKLREEPKAKLSSEERQNYIDLSKYEQ